MYVKSCYRQLKSELFIDKWHEINEFLCFSLGAWAGGGWDADGCCRLSLHSTTLSGDGGKITVRGTLTDAQPLLPPSGPLASRLWEHNNFCFLNFSPIYVLIYMVNCTQQWLNVTLIFTCNFVLATVNDLSLGFILYLFILQTINHPIRWHFVLSSGKHFLCLGGQITFLSNDQEMHLK